MLKFIGGLLGGLPMIWQIAAVGAVVVTVTGAITTGYLVWHHKVYQSGYEDAISDVAKQNNEATERVREAVSKVRSCRDGGGVWNQHLGVCAQQ